jgi:O-antigen ligase
MSMHTEISNHPVYANNAFQRFDIANLIGGSAPAYIFITLAALLGGAGNSYPIIELVLQLLALVIIVSNVPRISWVDASGPKRSALIWVVCLLALFGFQLVPLPWSVWSSLPHRDQASTILSAINQTGWRPFSLTWSDTLKDLFFLTIPLAALLLGMTSTLEQRINFLRIYLAVGVLSVILGALQISGANGLNSFYLFPTAHAGSATGLFVNRNHQAIFLDICVVLSAIPTIFDINTKRARTWTPGKSLLSLSVAAIFALGVLTTVSRAGAALLPLAFIGFCWVQIRSGAPKKWIGAIAAMILVAAGFVATTFWSNVVGQRFELVEASKRFTTWDDTVYAIGQTLPLGTGFGSFVPVYQTVESLEAVDRTISNHAHNEYLQYALEGGLPTLLLVAGATIILVWAFLQFSSSKSRSARQKSLSIASLVGVLLIALHNIVDYPLRMAAVAALFGLLSAFVLVPAKTVTDSRDTSRRERSSRPFFVLAVISALLAVPMSMTFLSEHYLLTGKPETAVKIWRSNSAAWVEISDRLMIAGSTDESADAAINSLKLAPLQTPALRNIALAAKSDGDRAEYKSFLELAGILGWRDKTTQILLIDDAMQSGDRAMVAQRIDSLLRRNYRKSELFGFLRNILGDAQANFEIAKRLAEAPPWRGGFFSSLADTQSNGVAGVAALAENLKRLNNPITDKEASQFLSSLIARQQYKEAGDFWRSVSGGELVGDGNFEQSEGKMTRALNAFSWRANALFGTNVIVAQPMEEWDGNAAIVSGNGISSGVVMEQIVALAPGRYQLELVQSQQDAQAEATRWQLTCLGRDGISASNDIGMAWSPARGSWERGQGEFIVGDAGCFGQKLGLVINPIDGPGVKLQIDDVSITRMKNSR